MAHTFCRWQNDFLIGDGVLELVGAEMFQLALEIISNFWQIL